MSKTTNRNLHNEEFHNCHHSPNVITIMYVFKNYNHRFAVWSVEFVMVSNHGPQCGYSDFVFLFDNVAETCSVSLIKYA